MKHLLLIINPVAGQKKAAKYLPEIISVFNRAEYDVHVYITSSQNDAAEAVALLRHYVNGGLISSSLQLIEHTGCDTTILSILLVHLIQQKEVA